MCINTRYDMMLVFKRVAASNPKALWMVAFAKVGFSLTWLSRASWLILQEVHRWRFHRRSGREIQAWKQKQIAEVGGGRSKINCCDWLHSSGLGTLGACVPSFFVLVDQQLVQHWVAFLVHSCCQYVDNCPSKSHRIEKLGCVGCTLNLRIVPPAFFGWNL